MGKLTLRCGDKVTIAKHLEDGKTEIYKFIISNSKKSSIGIPIIIETSILHKYLESIGLKPTKLQKQKALKKFPKSQKFYLSKIELLEIERKKKWYISILNKLAFWKEKKK